MMKRKTAINFKRMKSFVKIVQVKDTNTMRGAGLPKYCTDNVSTAQCLSVG